MSTIPPPTRASKPRYPLDRRLSLLSAIDAAKSRLHAAQATADPERIAVATLAHTAASADLDDEQDRLADSWRMLTVAALSRTPDEVAWLAHTIAEIPAVQHVLVDVLTDLLAPTVDWLRGEQADLADRIANVEAVLAAGVPR